jgi:hypothetical protein
MNTPPVHVGMGGMNQIMDLFKMQVLMKMMNGDGSQKSATGSMMTMIVLMGYDQFVKYLPQILTLIWLWLQTNVYGKQTLKEIPMISGPPPPASKPIRAFIQFERNPEKLSDPRIDAVIHHVCTLPDVRSLRYNGVEMIPNFKDSLMIENDIWFEISNPNSGTPSMSISGKDVKQEPILYRLSTYDHDITWLHKFVEQAQDNFEQEKRNKLGSESYYFDQITGGGEFRNPVPKGYCVFNKSKFTSNRSLNNVYLRQIDDLKQRVEFFIRRRDWYDSKGIPHTLGIVMYGHPGCGKTSTIKAIANETKRHIFNIALSSITTKEALKDLFYNDQIQILTNGKSETLNIPLKQRLYVIEDIDAMDSVVIKRSAEDKKADEQRKIKVEAEMELLKQAQGDAIARNMMQGKKEDETDKLDLSTMLNVLDGVRETPGRIIILSTNYPERLDEALLRPGRFDMMLEFEKHTPQVIKLHMEKHYDIELTDKQWARINQPSLDKKWTPAEVSQILFRRICDPNKAIDDLLYEDPNKLFKFSQMKPQKETSTDLESLLVEQSTDLTTLLEHVESNEDSSTDDENEEKQENEVIKTEIYEEDFPFSGGTSMTPDLPSIQQLQAIREVLKDLPTNSREFYQNAEPNYDHAVINEIKPDDNIKTAVETTMTHEMRTTIVQMLSSPMFQDDILSAADFDEGPSSIDEAFAEPQIIETS